MRASGCFRPVFGHLQAHGDVGIRRRPEDVAVETDPPADATGGRPAVAERDRDREIRLTGEDHGGDLQGPAFELQPDHVAVGHAQSLRRFGAEDRGVIPGQLGDRVGELL